MFIHQANTAHFALECIASTSYKITIYFAQKKMIMYAEVRSVLLNSLSGFTNLQLN